MHRTEQFHDSGIGLDFEAEGMRRAGVAFDGGNVVGELGGIFGGVGPAPGTPCFFIHPCDDAKGTRGTEVKALEKFTSLHGNDDAGSVVDRARS